MISNRAPSICGAVKLFRSVLPRFLELSNSKCAPSSSGALKVFQSLVPRLLDLSNYFKMCYLDLLSCQKFRIVRLTNSGAVKYFETVVPQFLSC